MTAVVNPPCAASGNISNKVGVWLWWTDHYITTTEHLLLSGVNVVSSWPNGIVYFWLVKKYDFINEKVLILTAMAFCIGENGVSGERE
ncbi:hypothetical protein [Salinisphaera sp. G21_0]|uniref:hypothetical protein n=1 Tax=Salinisphaera sp. G21_0 TaxID=2821094 RepID=UPI001ADA08A8|nr:hypothetical protein [Salinisphaera sp. G21_0]MBO9481202.1 hypothetical protein [Salinisphaera sp. G21_0]